MLEAPVLFLIFNRPELTEQVFAQIKKAQPKKLFIAADGPRKNNPEDVKLCAQTRELILDKIDWPCEVKTLFRDKNLGCGIAPAEAITWFFNEVQYGIVLEDDCLPALTFFKFCEELLLKYIEDERVIAISGTNLLEKYNTNKSFFFSIYGGNWGWASWSRAWKKFDYTMAAWKNTSCKASIKKFVSNDLLFNYLKKKFDTHFLNPANDVWDYQWFFTRLANNGLSIIPSFNLIKNIGFGNNATHTFNKESRIPKLNIFELEFPLLTNEDVVKDKGYDAEVYDNYLKPPANANKNLTRRILKKLNPKRIKA